MTYYIFIQNDVINGSGQCRQLTEGVTNLEVEEALYNAYAENPDMYIWDGTAVVIDPDYEAKQAQKERTRLDKLSMTRGDLFEALIFAFGKDENDIIQIVELMTEIDDITKKIYINRIKNALDFYRGYPAVDMIGQVLGITTEQMDMFFETKDWNSLVTVKEDI